MDLKQLLKLWLSFYACSGFFTPPNWHLLLYSGHATLEKSRGELQQQLELLEEEARHLRQSNTQLQLKSDTEDREKEDQQQEMERVLRDREYM